ncbi:MAG TPA: methyltransferase domain-containing protein [Chloroflexota bacterium]|nr:methyltransferase domain-containing protein [Chloroflexota bacterium]
MVETANSVWVDPSNAEQARAWDGDEGAYWAANAARFDETVAAYHRPLLDAAGIGAGDRVLDIGCGTGQTTRDAARAAVSGSALGLDLSARMIALARQLAAAEGLANVGFEQADAQIHPFEAGAFDVAISRTGAMFFGDPVAAFRNIAGALRQGGRLTLLAWQDLPRNEWVRELFAALAAGRELPAPSLEAPGPFSLADPARVRRILTAAGFADVQLQSMNAPMYFGPDAEDAYRFVLGLMGWMLEGLDEAGRARALDALRATLASHDTGHGVTYDSAAWLITANIP